MGYPEVAHTEGSISRYNSAVMVSPAGSVIANYRKHHLYMTDETWAEEGGDGFFASDVSALGRVAMGICMLPSPFLLQLPIIHAHIARVVNAKTSCSGAATAGPLPDGHTSH